MTSFVLDASMAMAWHFRDEASDRSRAISALGDDAIIVVPRHWFAEIANAVLMGERRQRATLGVGTRFVDRLRDLDLEVDEASHDLIWDTIVPLARAHRLTAYDALYLELTMRRGLPLASLDKDLNRAACAMGVDMVLPA